MIFCALDIGNTKAKFCLLNERLELLSCHEQDTETLFHPEKWFELFQIILPELDSRFNEAELRISCVSWRAFLALRVFLGYDSLADFNAHTEFDLNLITTLPTSSPFVWESAVPLNTSHIQGSIGTDRLLVAFAIQELYQRDAVFVSFGTATTIDIVDSNNKFFSGWVYPGIDTAYHGLTQKAIQLPSLNDLPQVDSFLNHSTAESLFSGVFKGNAILVDQFYQHQEKNLLLILTGGRAKSVSPFVKTSHIVEEYLVSKALVLLYLKNQGK